MSKNPDDRDIYYKTHFCYLKGTALHEKGNSKMREISIISLLLLHLNIMQIKYN